MQCHKSHMTFEDFCYFVKKDIKECNAEMGYTDTFPPNSVLFWDSEEWQEGILKEYNRFAKSCKTEEDWDLAVNIVSMEFDMMH